MTRVVVDGRELDLTNLEKPIYPEAGFTKAHVFDYYRRIAPAVLPHLRDRAITMKRYPHGVEGEHFYEKQCPSFAPEWIRRAPIPSRTRGANIDYVVVDDLPTLMWTTNLLNLELHTFLARAEAPDVATAMVFDLDPGPGADLPECAAVALHLRDNLSTLELRSYAKTSGGKGMQVYVPVRASFADTKAFALALATLIERAHPDDVTTNMRKSAREGRVLIDWAQNDAHKTTVCAYSLRASPTPIVSMPLAWPEVETLAQERDASQARIGPEEAIDRFERFGDRFRPVVETTQQLPTLTHTGGKPQAG